MNPIDDIARATDRPSTGTIGGGLADVLGEMSTDLVSCFEVLFPPGVTMVEHSHKRPSISICFSGEVEEVVAGIRFHLEASSIYARPGGVVHSNVFGPTPVRALVIELNTPFLERYPATADVIRHPALFHGAPMMATASALSNELRVGKGRSSHVAADALSLTLVSQLIRRGERKSVSPTTAWLNELVGYLKIHFREHLTINAIAETFDLNPSYLGRMFKQELEMSVTEYLRKLRIDAAIDLLASTETPISSIADQCAFADQAHFTRVFKSVVGTTPRAYRRLARRTAGAGSDREQISTA